MIKIWFLHSLFAQSESFLGKILHSGSDVYIIDSSSILCSIRIALKLTSANPLEKSCPTVYVFIENDGWTPVELRSFALNFYVFLKGKRKLGGGKKYCSEITSTIKQVILRL